MQRGIVQQEADITYRHDYGGVLVYTKGDLVIGYACRPLPASEEDGNGMQTRGLVTPMPRSRPRKPLLTECRGGVRI